jgi:hypothetical protein
MGKKSYFDGFFWVGRQAKFFLNGNFILFYWAWFFSEGQELMGKKRKRRNGEEKEKKEKKCWVGQARSLRRKTKKK